jgi:hypothetical protein
MINDGTNLVERKIWPMPRREENRNVRAIAIVAVPRDWLDTIEGSKGTSMDSCTTGQQMCASGGELENL